MEMILKHLKGLHASSRRMLVGLVGAFGTLALPGHPFAQAPTPGDLSHFAYDRHAPLNPKRIGVKVLKGVTIEDLTYTGSHGDTVPAYLVIPNGSGKFAAVIWGHWLMPDSTNANRTEFLEEAIALAPTGVVSLLIDAPQKRPDFKVAENTSLVAQQVIDLRRGFDLLVSRSAVDANRVAYVGHSWDAGTGAIVDAVDKRFAGFVFMSGPQSQTKRALSSPQMAELRKANDKAQLKQVEDSLKAEAWADPGSYAGSLGPSPALFQYGLHDEKWVPLTSAKDYVATASGPKTTEFYDADHALNAKARTDRDAFLSRVLRLGR